MQFHNNLFGAGQTTIRGATQGTSSTRRKSTRMLKPVQPILRKGQMQIPIGRVRAFPEKAPCGKGSRKGGALSRSRAPHPESGCAPDVRSHLIYLQGRTDPVFLKSQDVAGAIRLTSKGFRCPPPAITPGHRPPAQKPRISNYNPQFRPEYTQHSVPR